MTKAERIFKDNYRICKNHVKRYGFENAGYNGLESDEHICKRTCNDIQKHIDRERKRIEMSVKLGVEINYKLYDESLKMLQLTLSNEIKRL